MRTGLLLTGDRELDRTLRELPKNVRNKAIRQSTREVMKRIVLPTSRDFAPKQSGRLARSLRVRVAKGKNGRRLPRTVMGHSVVWTDKGTYYGSFQELGTKHNKPSRFLRDGLYKNRHLLTPAFVRYVRPRIGLAVAASK